MVMCSVPPVRGIGRGKGASEHLVEVEMKVLVVFVRRVRGVFVPPGATALLLEPSVHSP